MLLIKRATDTCRPDEDARIEREDPRRIGFNLNGDGVELGSRNDRSSQRSKRSVIDLPANFERIVY